MNSVLRAALAPINNLIDFLSPRYCLICDDLISKDNQIGELNYLCNSCYYSLDSAPESESIIDRMFDHFDADDVSITNIYSLFKLHEKDFAKVIYNLKYHKLWKIGYEFGLLLGEKISKVSESKYDCVVAVPIHIAKKRERGYNQSDFIAKGVSKVLNIPDYSRYVERQIYTTSQTKLNSDERKKNIAGAYKIPIKSSNNFHNKHVLIVDDVFTTGSTINHLGNELLNNGAKQVDCATLGAA